MNGSGMEGVEHKVNAWKVLNIKLKKKSQEVLGKVINLIKESEAEIPESVLDRAHRIGPTYMGKKVESIIVRFTAFRHRTLFYTNHKKIKSGARIRLDLTKDRYNLLVSARKRVNNCPKVNYVYDDINCRLKVKMADQSHKFFDQSHKFFGRIEWSFI